MSEFSINTNLGALAALQSLDATQQALNNTQNIVSTGQLVSSASDNPAIYSIAQTMNANIAGLTAVQDNISFAQSVLGVAASAASQISSQLAFLQQTVTQGQQTGISASTMNSQIQNILNNINNFANNATFNGVNLLASSNAAGVQFTSLTIQDSVNAGGTLQINSMLGTGINNMVQQLNLSNLSVQSGGVEFSFNSSYAPKAGDYLQISNGTNNWVFEFQTSGATPVAAPSGYTLGSNATGGQNYLTNVMISSTSSPMAAVGALITALQQQGFGASLDSNGNLYVLGNNLQSSGTAWEASGRAYASTNTTNEAGVTQTALSGGQAAISIVQAAISSMNNISSIIGATQQELTGMSNFSSSLSTSLTEGVGALTDANMAAESAQLTALQTKQQLAIRTLSIANAQPQVLLNLFQ